MEWSYPISYFVEEVESNFPWKDFELISCSEMKFMITFGNEKLQGIFLVLPVCAFGDMFPNSFHLYSTRIGILVAYYNCMRQWDSKFWVAASFALNCVSYFDEIFYSITDQPLFFIFIIRKHFFPMFPICSECLWHIIHCLSSAHSWPFPFQLVFSFKSISYWKCLRTTRTP